MQSQLVNRLAFSGENRRLSRRSSCMLCRPSSFLCIPSRFLSFPFFLVLFSLHDQLFNVTGRASIERNSILEICDSESAGRSNPIDRHFNSRVSSPTFLAFSVDPLPLYYCSSTSIATRSPTTLFQLPFRLILSEREMRALPYFPSSRCLTSRRILERFQKDVGIKIDERVTDSNKITTE